MGYEAAGQGENGGSSRNPPWRLIRGKTVCGYPGPQRTTLLARRRRVHRRFDILNCRGWTMSNSTQTVRVESDPRQAYKAVTLRLARERVTDARPLRDVLKVVTEVAATALHVKRVSVWFFLNEPRSIRCRL